MKTKSIHIFILILLISACNSNPNDNMNKIIEEIKQIENEFVPDKRVAIFEFVQNDNRIFLKTNIADIKGKLVSLKEKFSNFQFEILPNLDKENQFGIVNLSVANMRGEPKHSAELVSQVLLGTPIKIFEKDEEWYRIQTPDGYIAWVDDDSFTPFSADELNEYLKNKRIVFTKEYGHVYSKRNLNSDKISDIVCGDILKLLERKDNYLKVEFPDGRTGYLNDIDAVEYSNWISGEKPTGYAIKKTAERFIGVPYLWGGTSSKGLDCSGFTKTVYFLNGIVLARDASQQVSTGNLIDTEIDFKNLEIGDLLFFGRKATSQIKEKVTHVAIYIGNDEFIHASGRVKINSLNPEKSNFSKHRFNTFIRAKRILNSIGKNGIEEIENNNYYSGNITNAE